MEKFTRNVKTNETERLFSTNRQCLAHADDVAALGLELKHTVEKIKDMTNVASQLGLT
jgi:DNA-binding phage protein